MARAYDHARIEQKWQAAWEKARLYETRDGEPGRENFYLLVEFPYPSGNLHVGHWYAFAVPDILARYMRMNGRNVLYPIGFDAFGLPAENAAIKNKLNPRDWTERNIAHMSQQIRSMGTTFDWSRMVKTIDPEYYKWTQWMFLQFLKSKLAYRKETAVNWCPSDKTVLANEQVVDGKCERCGAEVVQKQMLQWNLKITDYADRLIDDLDGLDWPEQIKESQRNWIGRSEGAEIDFPLDDGKRYKFVILHGYQSRADRPRWLWVKSELERLGHEVHVPQLPHADAPVEEEQVIAALAATEYDEDTILVGHSLGAVVAMKALQRLNKKIARLVLIAPAIDPAYPDAAKRPFHVSFKWNIDYTLLKALAVNRLLLSDLKEPAARINYIKWLAPKLDAQLVETYAEKEHFTGDREPDVLMWLRPTIRVFTTRPDTLFGATYLVLAPEHPFVQRAIAENLLSNAADVRTYVKQASRKSDLERQADQKDKTGVELKGLGAVNPATGEQIPVWVADYVLGHYGTGAIMAVPAHDERDYEFAKKFELPMKQVVGPVVRQIKGTDAVREGEPITARDAVMCIVKHWESDEYLCQQWIDHPEVKTFISGGIEAGEDVVAAAFREIREESGYTNAKFIRQVKGYSFVEFYHQVKKKNIRARFRYLYFELQSDKKVEVSEDELKKHSLVWKKRDEVHDFLHLLERDAVWTAFESGSEPAYTGDGRLVNSGEFDGLPVADAKKAITGKYGRSKRTYKLRDWIVSRQRYWGVPIPVIHCTKCGIVPVPEQELPVLLPEVEDYLPEGSGKSPLAKAKDWVEVTCPECGAGALRETDTLDTFVDSSWYFLRYTDPVNKKEFASQRTQGDWMPVDLYSGGAEHTTMHLLYSRFWHKALFDLRFVADSEPYKRRMNRSIILGPDGQKMSKSRGNVIDPDNVVNRLGADTVRMYLAFIGPYNEVSNYPWNPDGVVGVRRFLERMWRMGEMVVEKNCAELHAPLHKMLKKVGDDIALMKFNTAIAQLMTFVNVAEKAGSIGQEQWGILLRALAPFAPHIVEELWSQAGHKRSIFAETWPEYSADSARESHVLIAVQIDGKTRGTVEVSADAADQEMVDAARSIVAERLGDRTPARTVVVPGRLVNFVTGT